jgi:hypothetical protein
MAMAAALSPKICTAISEVVKTAAKAQVLVQVYAEAEKICRTNLEENIALEDIVEEMIRRSSFWPGYEADPNQARAAILGEPVH